MEFILLGLWIWSLVAIFQYSREEYLTLHRVRANWVVVAVLFGLFGSFFWLVLVRPHLEGNRNA